MWTFYRLHWVTYRAGFDRGGLIYWESHTHVFAMLTYCWCHIVLIGIRYISLEFDVLSVNNREINLYAILSVWRVWSSVLKLLTCTKPNMIREEFGWRIFLWGRALLTKEVSDWLFYQMTDNRCITQLPYSLPPSNWTTLYSNTLVHKRIHYSQRDQMGTNVPMFSWVTDTIIQSCN